MIYIIIMDLITVLSIVLYYRKTLIYLAKLANLKN